MAGGGGFQLRQAGGLREAGVAGFSAVLCWLAVGRARC